MAKTLQTRMTVYTLTVFLLCMWSLNFYATSTLRTDMLRTSGEQQLSMVTYAAKELNDELEARLKALAVVAATVAPSLGANPQKLQTFLEGQLLLSSSFNGGSYITGVDGIALASMPLSAQRRGASYMDREFVAAALLGGTSTVGTPQLFEQKEGLVVGMAVPILRSDGQVMGALVGITELSKPNFLSLVSDNRYGKSGGFLLVDRKQQLVVMASDKRRNMHGVGKNALVDRYVAGFEGYGIHVNTFGVEVLSSAKGIPAANWYLTATLPTQEAFAPIADMQMRLLLASLFLSAVACGLTWWLMQRQLTPVLSTVAKLSLMADETIPIEPIAMAERSELGDLVRGFNRVLKTLEDREIALLQSEIFRKAIFDAVDAEIAVLNHEGVIVAVNDQWLRVAIASGLSSASAAQCAGIGVNYLAVCAASSGEGQELETTMHIVAGIRSVLDKAQTDFSCEYICQWQGEDRWYTLTCTPLGLTDGGAVVAHTEITARKRAQDLQLQSETRLQLMQRGSNHAFWDWDLPTNTMFYSERWGSMLGYRDRESARDADYWHRLIHPDDAQRLKNTYSTAMADGAMGFDIEFRLLHKDGHYVTVASRGLISRDKDGKAVRASGANIDLTEHKQAELDLRTAKAAADAANTEKSRFLAAVSHDLRQPVAALSLYVDVLKQRTDPDNVRLVSNIDSCCTSLSGLLTNLLDVSMLDAAVVTPHISSFLLATPLQALLAVHSAEAAAKGLGLQVRPCADVVAHTDQRLFSRILGNFISNAVRFTQTGGVLVGCRRHAGALWVEVWDTGIGIADDRSGVIFDAFTQLGDAAHNTGSGLGLSIAKQTAALLGLRVRMHSRLGRGSMFAIEVPTVGDPVPADPAPLGQVTRKQLIALVEDHQRLSHALVLALETLGHEVVAAADLDALMGQLGTRAPDLAISDYHLEADLTGIDVIQALRQKYGGQFPAILITGDTDANIVHKAAAIGVEVLRKPLDVNALLRFVHAAAKDAAA